jgi:hypothetical protein
MRSNSLTNTFMSIAHQTIGQQSEQVRYFRLLWEGVFCMYNILPTFFLADPLCSLLTFTALGTFPSLSECHLMDLDGVVEPPYDKVRRVLSLPLVFVGEGKGDGLAPKIFNAAISLELER